ncbi:MAG: hemolysin III family protein [Balneolaceae bacterium]|nr:hemolysin III family protein [Balneolaceae bacterium]
MAKLSPPRESFNAWSHFVGAVIAAVFLFLLIQASAQDPLGHQVAFWVYGISVILMFFSSYLYHSIRGAANIIVQFRRIDHFMIYTVIAGTYTPICAIPLEGGWQLGMLTGIWVFALAGIFKKIFWLNAPRWFSTVIYLFMGWVAVLIFPTLWEVLPKTFSYWIAAGGVFYTIGAVIYGIKKPNPIPGRFGSHEIWHLFVMAGAFCHLWAIYYYLPGFNLS